MNKAFTEIYGEYADAMGDQENRLYVNTLKEVSMLTSRLKMIYLMLDVMSLPLYIEDFAKELNRILSSSFKFDFNNQDSYFKDINRCYNRSKGIKIELDLKVLSFEAIKVKNESTSKKPTREYFQSILITLSDFAKYPIRDQVTTFEFCERVKRFNDHVKKLESIPKK